MRLQNLARNFHLLHLEHALVWFSYATPVAFETDSTGLVIRENSGGPTTSKHLNSISPDKSRRVSALEFEKALENLHL